MHLLQLLERAPCCRVGKFQYISPPLVDIVAFCSDTTHAVFNGPWTRPL